MSSINDWAAKAARRICIEVNTLGPKASEQRREERFAAIIATFAEPLVKLVQESRREHYHCDDSWYCCGKCTHPCDSDEEDHEHDEDCCVESHKGRTKGVCSCGADAWNARVDAALNGLRIKGLTRS